MSASFLAAARIREREVLDNDRPPLATVLNIYQRFNRHFRNAGFVGFFSLLPSPIAYGYGRFEFGRRSQAVRNVVYTVGGRGITDAWFHAPRGLIHALNRLRYWLTRSRLRIFRVRHALRTIQRWISRNTERGRIRHKNYIDGFRAMNPVSHSAAGAA